MNSLIFGSVVFLKYAVTHELSCTDQSIVSMSCTDQIFVQIN